MPAVLRTSDERFADLPGYPFPPQYVEVGDPGLRMHYAEAGPSDGLVALLLHGQPTWSYLYRHVLAALAAAACAPSRRTSSATAAPTSPPPVRRTRCATTSAGSPTS